MYIALTKANKEYTEKLASGKATGDKILYSLCWTVDELGRLNNQGREMYVEITSLLELLSNSETDVIRANIARRISKLKEGLVRFIQGVSRHQLHMCLSQ